MVEPSHDGSEGINVLIAEVPALLASVVRQTVNEEGDMTVVDEVDSENELSNALQHRIDVVITASQANELGPQFRALLFGPRSLPIVMISLDGSRIDVYGRSITRGGGIASLTALIREAVAGARVRIGG